MAKISPRKVFQYSIEFPGFPYENFLCQEFQTADLEVEPVPHSEGVYDVKTAGRIKVGNLTLKNIMRAQAGSLETFFFWDWLNLCQDMYLGGGSEPMGTGGYYRTVIVRELGVDGQTVINTHIFEEAWPTKINGLPLNRRQSDNTIETVELSVNRVNKTL
jgi:hypothetical protein